MMDQFSTTSSQNFCQQEETNQFFPAAQQQNLFFQKICRHDLWNLHTQTDMCGELHHEDFSLQHK